MPKPESTPLPNDIKTSPLANDIETNQQFTPDPDHTQTNLVLKALKQLDPNEEHMLNGETFKQITETVKEITLRSDLSRGETEEDKIPIDSETAVRLLEVLKEKNIPYLKVLLGGVAVTVAVGAGLKTKRIIDEFIEKKRIASLTDEQVVQFKSLVDKHYQTVISDLSYRIQGSPQAVEDLTQNVFKRAFSAYSRFKPAENLKDPERAWFLRIANNLAKNYFRDQKRKMKKQTQTKDLEDKDSGREIVLVDPMLNQMHALEYLISNTPEKALQLRQAIASLPDKRRHLLHLKLQLGLSNLEIAYVFKTTKGAIKSLYSRTLAQLRNRMIPDKS